MSSATIFTHITQLGRGKLYRAIVSLPDCLCEHKNDIQDRIVFFELDRTEPSLTKLEQLLSSAWGIDVTGWIEEGLIYNISDANELLRDGLTDGDATMQELRLLETGGSYGQPSYASRENTDLFVPPKVSRRLNQLLGQAKLIAKSRSSS